MYIDEDSEVYLHYSIQVQAQFSGPVATHLPVSSVGRKACNYQQRAGPNSLIMIY